MGDELPHSDVEVPLNTSKEELDAAVRSLLAKLLPPWANLNQDEVQITKISGGITNILLKADPGQQGKEQGILPVTIRMFGPNTEVVINREREFEALKALTANGFGSPLLGFFNNGYVQAFIFARTLEPEDMLKPEYAKLIASHLRRFHAVEVPGSREPQLWVDLDSFVKTASQLSFEDPAKQQVFSTISFAEVESELRETQVLCEAVASPVVFCHNDLLSGNFMHNEETGAFYIIDFEYGAYGYRGHDIGNHFNEYAGFECDYSRFPNKEGQELFFRNYLNVEAPASVPQEDVDLLYVETAPFTLTSHLYWAVWALIQAKFSPIDFDYLGYFFLRYNEYKRRKPEVTAIVAESNRRF